MSSIPIPSIPAIETNHRTCLGKARDNLACLERRKRKERNGKKYKNKVYMYLECRIEKTLEIYRKWCLECRNDNIGILR
jgi:hypothetical protein